MSDTPLTDAELARLEELAAKATPGPWANTDTVFELCGAHPDDWWKIYAKKTEDVGVYPYITVCSMSFRATDEEVAEARRVSWNDHAKMYDPGQAGNDARYIAAACNAVPSLVAEVRRLRAEDETSSRIRIRMGMDLAGASAVLGEAIADFEGAEAKLQAEKATLRERVEVLEKMADWLAGEHIKFLEIMHPLKEGRYAPEDMIEAAREAITQEGK